MPKQQTPLRYVAKIPSSIFSRAKFDLKLSFDDMRRAGEIVALGDSQMFDFIDELRGVTDCDSKAKELKQRIKDMQREDDSAVNRNRLRKMRRELTQLLYKEDYLMVIMQSTKDFKRMCEKPFKFNGHEMKFLLATTGGVKTSTMIFTKVDIYDKLVERLNNGRDMTKLFSPAKLEAYMALACSSSIKVSEPKGVLVVDDCITHFKENAIHLMDGDIDPVMEYIENYDIELKESDGYGLMTPELSERWGIELGDGGGITGCCLRNAFLKGMAFTFDFRRFAREIAHTETVKDIWGNEHNINDIELIVPVSMLKLWDSYDNWEHYHKCCEENHYGFRVTKVCPLELEEQRTTNYQNLNPYDWDDETVKLFIKPTIQNIHDTLCGDWAKTILYSRGVGMKEETLRNMPNDWCKAVMADERMMDDPFVRQKLHNMLERRINDAKIGVIDVEGNYSILSGDPYSLCQSVFGLEVTGLLKAGECYHEHWANKGVMEVVAYRAPMSAPNNIRTLYVSATEEQHDWYRYMKTCTILNSWDSTCHALNGADKDSDMVMTTNNVWLLNYAPHLPVIMCEQRSAPKCPVEWKHFVDANIAAAGDDIGAITNRCTAMYDKFTMTDDPELKKILEYRIQCSQHFQQNAIDKAKGVVTKPQNKEWYDLHALATKKGDTQEDIARKEFNRKLVVNRKPYFMRYVYADTMREWKDFVRKTQDNCLRFFRMTLEQLRQHADEGKATQEQLDFLVNYEKYMPVSDGNCVVNRICHYIENEFETQKDHACEFNPSILKGGMEATESQKKQIAQLYKDYTGDMRHVMDECARQHVDNDERKRRRMAVKEYYIEQCGTVCSNAEQLCNAMVDVCYKANTSKAFVWDVCGDQLVKNVMAHSDGKLHYPMRDDNGIILYKGHRYTMRTVEVNNDNTEREEVR